jgi:hypothetical protein
MWAAAHGVASLMVAKPFLPWADKMQFAYRALGAASLGRAVYDLHGGHMTPEEVERLVKAQPSYKDVRRRLR